MKPELFLVDTETTGLAGICVIIQYSRSPNGEVHIFCPWRRPVQETLDLIAEMMDHGVVAFNLRFDAFHLQKLFVMFTLLRDKHGPGAVPLEHVPYLRSIERDAWKADICLKPRYAVDLLLHAKKGPYQSLMDRKPVRLRKIHVSIAPTIAKWLEDTVQVDGIYFDRRKNKDLPHWSICECKEDGTSLEDWRDIKLSFAPSASLKSLAKALLGADPSNFSAIMPEVMSDEPEYAPFADAVPEGGHTWDQLIQNHVEFWETDQEAIKYAENDIVYLQQLYAHGHFKGISHDDNDSVLAWMVGVVRHRGFPIDCDKLRKLREKYREAEKLVPNKGRRSQELLDWLEQLLGPIRFKIIKQRGTERKVIEKLILEWPEVAESLQKLSDARQAEKRVQFVDKLLLADRAHPDLNVMGSLSGRMSGTGGLNYLAMPSEPEFRNCFIFEEGDFLCHGGDFDSFEVAIAEAAYKDEALSEDMASGKDFHSLFGAAMYDETYEAIKNSKPKRKRAKAGGFAMFYGGTTYTLVDRLSVTAEQAEAGVERLFSKYKGIGREAERVEGMFQSMYQPQSGGAVQWHEPAEYIESLLGFRRYFTLEHKICRALFDLAQNPPREWRMFDAVEVQRRKTRGKQSAFGAALTAVYAAAFQIQAQNTRAARNHVIQSTGAGITKELQVRLWDLQPVGVHPWQCAGIQIHDEICLVVRKNLKNKPGQIVRGLLDYYRGTVKYIAMDWEENLFCWKGRARVQPTSSNKRLPRDSRVARAEHARQRLSEGCARSLLRPR